MMCRKYNGRVILDGYSDLKCWACCKDYTVVLRVLTRQYRNEIRMWRIFGSVGTGLWVEE